MPHHLTSKDGTRIAYDLLGEGPPVVVVGGIFCDRARLAGLATTLADRLAGHASVVNYVAPSSPPSWPPVARRMTHTGDARPAADGQHDRCGAGLVGR